MSEYQIDYDTAVKELSEAKVEGNIVVFMGAGVSKKENIQFLLLLV